MKIEPNLAETRYFIKKLNGREVGWRSQSLCP
jgi:hypothetical protein